MRVIFLGRKPGASKALRHLVAQGVEVACVVAPQPPDQPLEVLFWRPHLKDTAAELNLPLLTLKQLRACLRDPAQARRQGLNLSSIDLVISYLFWQRLHGDLIDLARLGCFNFHPGPLPEFRRMRGYNFAILEQAAEYGASLHWVDKDFDTGDLVRVDRFPIDRQETAFSLERKTQQCIYRMFVEFIAHVQAGKPIPRLKQGTGHSATKEEMNALKAIRPDDSAELIDRKIRAFWYPPHDGATIELNGKTYTLVDREVLQQMGAYLHGKKDPTW